MSYPIYEQELEGLRTHFKKLADNVSLRTHQTVLLLKQVMDHREQLDGRVRAALAKRKVHLAKVATPGVFPLFDENEQYAKDTAAYDALREELDHYDCTVRSVLDIVTKTTL